MKLKKSLALIVTAVCALNSNSATLRAQNFQTKAVFELVVDKSNVLKPGTSRINAESAFVSLAHGLIGNSNGVEIIFFTKPITAAANADILKNDAKELKKGSYAALVLFIDKGYKVWQANLSYVVPGTTVVRTVAWKPEDLRKYFSDYKFDGKRLSLKTRGVYRESGSSDDTISLSWNVDLNLPVIREVQR